MSAEYTFTATHEDISREMRAEKVRAIAGEGPMKNAVRVTIGGVEHPASEAFFDNGTLPGGCHSNRRHVRLNTEEGQFLVHFLYDDVDFVTGSEARQILSSVEPFSVIDMG